MLSIHSKQWTLQDYFNTFKKGNIMKLTTVLFLLLALSPVYALTFTPSFELTLLEDNSVKLTVINKDDVPRNCSYKISWLEGLSYKRYFGMLTVSPGAEGVVHIKNDPHSKIVRLKGKVDCEAL